MSKFLNLYSKYMSLISEGSEKQLAPMLQSQWLKSSQKSSWNELDDSEKEELKTYIADSTAKIKMEVEKISDNPQEQSWIYDCLKSQTLRMPEDADKTREALEALKRINRRPDVSKKKALSEFKSYSDLYKYTEQFNKSVSRAAEVPFKKLFENGRFNIYEIRTGDYEKFNLYYGGNTDENDFKENSEVPYWNTGWCVAKNVEYFDDYMAGMKLNERNYLLWTNKDNSPFALLHFGSKQFKDTSDEPMRDTSKEVVDTLLKCFELKKLNYKDYFKDDDGYDYEDFVSYQLPISKAMSNGKSEIEVLEEIRGWKWNEAQQCFDSDTKVVLTDADIDSNGHIKWKFGTVKDKFNCSSCDRLKDLTNSPDHVEGDFICDYNDNLTSLKGCTPIIEGSCFIAFNKSLTTLENGPKIVGGLFSCQCDNELKNLKGAPRKASGRFNCSDCASLESLEGLPETVSDLEATECRKLLSLEGMPKIDRMTSFNISNCVNLSSLKGSPRVIIWSYDCSHTGITTLEGAPEFVGRSFSCYGCRNLKSLEGAPARVYGDFNASNNKELDSLVGISQEINGSINVSKIEGKPFKDERDKLPEALKSKKIIGYFDEEQTVKDC